MPLSTTELNDLWKEANILWTTQVFPSTPTHPYTNHTPRSNSAFLAGWGRNDNQDCIITLYGKQIKNHAEESATFSLQPEEANDHLMNSREENITVILFAAG